MHFHQKSVQEWLTFIRPLGPNKSNNTVETYRFFPLEKHSPHGELDYSPLFLAFIKYV